MTCAMLCHSKMCWPYSLPYDREIVAEFLNNLRETKLKIYKSVFVLSVVPSELFKHKGKTLTGTHTHRHTHTQAHTHSYTHTQAHAHTGTPTHRHTHTQAHRIHVHMYTTNMSV